MIIATLGAVINNISLVQITISEHVSGLTSPPSVNNGQYGPDPLPPPDADIINDTSLCRFLKAINGNKFIRLE